MFKDALVKAPIIIRLYFTKLFVLDINWSIWGAGVIMS
jgi:hypothetical protein